MSPQLFGFLVVAVAAVAGGVLPFVLVTVWFEIRSRWEDDRV